MSAEKRTRDFGLDLIRAAAAVLVLSVHFFMNDGFYDAPFQGAGMAASAVIRMACMTCVPLFMVLTGYLCVDRAWGRGYYRKLMPILLTYLLAAAVCLAFRWLWLGERFSALGALRRILDFSAAPYAWYVEMYIGLFLLTPFLNAAWRGLEERGRRALLATLVVMTALPTVTNLAGQVLPDWWTGVYPLTYYAAGAWLREHPVTVKKRWLLAGWLGLAAVAGLGQYAGQALLWPGSSFQTGGVNYWGSLLVLVETVCLFSLLNRCSGERCPAPIRRCVGQTARLSLPIYLISYVTDQLVYPPLMAAVPDAGSRLPWMPLSVASNLICAGLLAWVLDRAAQGLMRLVPKQKAA